MLDPRIAVFNDFKFSNFKLRSFNNPKHAADVEGAANGLEQKLGESYDKRVKPWLQQELLGNVDTPFAFFLSPHAGRIVDEAT